MCIYNNVYMLLLSQQVKWNHFIMTSVSYIDRCISIFVVSSRRNKTNPHHRNKFIPVLHTTHLQAFKPKLSTYDQLLEIDQQDVSFYVCVRKLKHFQPHSLLCHLWCRFDLRLVRFFMWYVYMMMIKIWKRWRSSFDERCLLLFFII